MLSDSCLYLFCHICTNHWFVCLNCGVTDGLFCAVSRLLAIFCVINMLNYIDRGVIASNGVNGSLGTCTEGDTCTGGSGIQ
jgi:hypothetical protein